MKNKSISWSDVLSALACFFLALSSYGTSLEDDISILWSVVFLTFMLIFMGISMMFVFKAVDKYQASRDGLEN